MMASSWALRLISQYPVPGTQYPVKPAKRRAFQLDTGYRVLGTVLSSPIIPHRSVFRHHFFEMGMLSYQHFAEDVILPHLDRLQPDQFEQRQKHADQRRP